MDLPLRIWTDEGSVLATFHPGLTSTMMSELNEILRDRPRYEEAVAVLQGLAEDWERQVDIAETTT